MPDNLEENKTETPQGEDNSQEVEARKAERHAQQLAWSKQEVDRLKSIAIKAAYKAAESDANSLLELNEQDPNLADEVAKKFGYDSIKEVQEKLNGNQEEKRQDPDERFEEKYQERRSKEVHETSLGKAKKIIAKLPEGLQENAKTYFDKLSKGRTLDEQTAKEFAEMATLYVSRDEISQWNFSEWLAQLSSTWLSNSKKKKEKEAEWVLDASWNFVLSSNEWK